MNWTGGSLSRSRNARGTLFAKQKDYFARARGKLQSGRSPRSEIQSFDLGQWKPTLKISPAHPSKSKSLRQSPGQSTLDAFENVQPVVQRLETLKSQNVSNKRERSPLQPLNSKTVQLNGEATQPIAIGSSQSSSSSAPQSPIPKPRAQHTSWPDNVKYMSIEDRRCRLLEMNDWVGIRRPTTKPVRMQFADPEDRDLIGKRRKLPQIDHIEPTAKRRMVARRAPLIGREAAAISAAQGQDYNLDDISIRIGSAVDRYGTQGITQGSRTKRQQDSVFSDELLDDGSLAPVHNASSPMPLSLHSASTPILLSGYGDRDILTPSAFMDCSTSASSLPSQGRIKKPIRSSSLARSLESFNPASPREVSPSDSGSRSDSDSSPVQPIQRTLKNRAEYQPDDITDEHAFDQMPNADVRTGGINSASQGKGQRQRIIPIAGSPDMAVTNWAEEENQMALGAPKRLSEPEQLAHGTVQNRHRVEKGSTQQAEIKSFTNTNAHEGQGSTPSNLKPQEKPARSREDEMWRNLVHLDARDPRVPRQAAPPISIGQDSGSNEPKDTTCSIIQPPPINPAKIAQDEEAIWRKFVFGDDDFNDCVPGQIEIGSQEPSPRSYRYACTQPSLIAEIDTSPLKQNPHLADVTFDESSSILSEAPSLRSRDRKGDDRQESKKGMNPRDRDVYSIPSSDIGGSGTVNAAPGQSSLPKGIWKANESSLIGQASSSEIQSLSVPENRVSSDEVHRSPDKEPCEAKANGNSDETFNASPHRPGNIPSPTEPKKQNVIYKKPPRYVGSKTSDPVEPTRLGERVLRSGVRVNGNVSRKWVGRKGKVKGRTDEEDRMEVEEEEDEILDD